MFTILMPDYTSKSTQLSMSYSSYYERLDFEFIKWDSIVDIVDRKRTLEELLKIIYDKYSLVTLSFIFRKSIIQIQMKLQELGLSKFLASDSKSVQKTINGKIFRNKEIFKLTITQTEDFEIEKWFMENNNFQYFEPEKIKIEEIWIASTIDNYIKNKEYETLFKFLVVFCNFMRIPYELKKEFDEDREISFVLKFSVVKKYLTTENKILLSLNNKLLESPK